MMMMMTRVCAAAAACLLSAGAEAAVTYTLTQTTNISVSFSTADPIAKPYTITDFTGQTCRQSGFFGGSSPCTSLTFDPTYTAPLGNSAVQIAIQAASGTSFYYLDGTALGRNGTFTSGTGFGPGVTLTVSGVTSAPPTAAAVPEPATWAMMLLGFGGLGYAMRRRSGPSARIRFA